MDDIDKSCEPLGGAKVLRDIPIRLDRDDMLRRTGLSGRKRPVAQSLISEFEGIVRDVESGLLVRPAAVTRVLKILDVTPDHVVISRGVTLSRALLKSKAPNATHTNSLSNK